jgi:hypothetical protein
MGTMPSASEAMAVKAPTERSKLLPLAHCRRQLDFSTRHRRPFEDVNMSGRASWMTGASLGIEMALKWRE